MSDIYEVSNVENNEVAEETSEKKDRKLGKKEVLIGGGLLFGIAGVWKLGKKVKAEVTDYREYRRWKKSYNKHRAQQDDYYYDEVDDYDDAEIVDPEDN